GSAGNSCPTTSTSSPSGSTGGPPEPEGCCSTGCSSRPQAPTPLPSASSSAAPPKTGTKPQMTRRQLPSSRYAGRRFEYDPSMNTPAYVPPGWPSQVRPPGAPGWEATAIAYLLDCCPADFRAYPVLPNHPVVLAQFATHFVNGQQEASQRGLADLRTSLSEYVD